MTNSHVEFKNRVKDILDFFFPAGYKRADIGSVRDIDDVQVITQAEPDLGCYASVWKNDGSKCCFYFEICHNDEDYWEIQCNSDGYTARIILECKFVEGLHKEDERDDEQ